MTVATYLPFPDDPVQLKTIGVQLLETDALISVTRGDGDEVPSFSYSGDKDPSHVSSIGMHAFLHLVCPPSRFPNPRKS